MTNKTVNQVLLEAATEVQNVSLVLRNRFSRVEGADSHAVYVGLLALGWTPPGGLDGEVVEGAE